ncbi:hypothetical protein ACO0K0_02750 [Undibacterium sp. SXout11W]|uniref:hypothetical protein n=1 Tax=Undibacterium sp. SXout11W TaxID=3413050 RepID=UPI003BF048F6
MTSNPDEAELAMLKLADMVVTELHHHSRPQSALIIAKRLKIRMSTLMRCLAYLGDAEIDGQRGLGWVLLHQDDDRLLLSLSGRGRSVCDDNAAQADESVR